MINQDIIYPKAEDSSIEDDKEELEETPESGKKSKKNRNLMLILIGSSLIIIVLVTIYVMISKKRLRIPGQFGVILKDNSQANVVIYNNEEALPAFNSLISIVGNNPSFRIIDPPEEMKKYFIDNNLDINKIPIINATSKDAKVDFKMLSAVTLFQKLEATHCYLTDIKYLDKYDGVPKKEDLIFELNNSLIGQVKLSLSGKEEIKKFTKNI